MLKETITSTKSIFAACLVIALLFATMKESNAQNFENRAGGTYSVGGAATANSGNLTAKRGIIRMRGVTGGANGGHGEFTGNAQLGATAASPIAGTVIWAKKGDQNTVQNVQSGVYYTNLGVQEIGKKVFGTTGSDAAGTVAYYVSNKFMRYKSSAQAVPYGQFEITSFDASTYPNIVHECNSDFFYNGQKSQSILGSFGNSGSEVSVTDNCYTTLTKTGTGQAVIYTPVITAAWLNEAGTSTSIVTGNAGIGSLTLQDILVCQNVPPSEDDSIEVTPDPPPGPDPEDPNPPPGENTAVCAITLAAAKVLTVNESFYFVDPDNNSRIITEAANSPFCVTAGDPGTDRNTLTSDNPSTAPSKVIYSDGATSIAPARVDNTWKGYGIVEIDGNVGVGGEVIIAAPYDKALVIKDGAGINTLNNLYDGTGTLTGMDDYRRITFAHSWGNIDYEGGCGEVLGWIYRSASDNAYEYNYHNVATKLASDAIGGAVSLTSFGMLMTNSTLPNSASYNNYNAVGNQNYAGSWDSKAEVPLDPTTTAYVNRIWEVDYAGTGTLQKVTLGFLPTEIPAVFGYGNTALDPTNEAWKKSVRGYEAYVEAGNGKLTTLVGHASTGDPSPWAYTNGSGSGACDYVLASQTSTINLNGSTAPGSTGDAAWDMAIGSQFVFGNQPLIFTSIRNGRWSDPGTWDKQTTPTSQDNVNITYLIYTGYYNSATASNAGTAGYFLGGRQWPTNEYDLSDVRTITGNAFLADSVTIKAVNYGGAGSTGPTVALIIGSEETSGDRTADNALVNHGTQPQSAMDFSVPLLFGVITNESVSSNEATWHNLTMSKLDSEWKNNSSNAPNLNGLWITSGPAATDPSAIINPRTFNNAGTFVNEAIFELGHEE